VSLMEGSFCPVGGAKGGGAGPRRGVLAWAGLTGQVGIDGGAGIDGEAGEPS
jgi:hypothetical protein